MKEHEKPAGRETAYQSTKKVETTKGIPKSAQPRDDESLGNHSLAHAAPDRLKGTGDRNKEILHHA